MYNDPGGNSHTYLDLQIVNGDTSGADYVPVQFNETRNSPFLMNPSEFYVSVIRFQLETGLTLPTYIPQMKLGGANNETVYTFTLELTDTSYNVFLNAQVTVLWVREDESVPLPSSPLTQSDLVNQSYYGYSYQHFVDMLNNALVSAMTNIASQYISATGAPLPATASRAPFFLLDQGTKRLSLIANFETFAFPPYHIQYKLFCNSSLFNWIGSFPFRYKGQNQPLGKNYQFVIERVPNVSGVGIANLYQVNNATPSSPATFSYNALQMYQEYSTVDLWRAVDKIIFTTSLLPIASGFTSAPKVYNSQTSDLLNVGNNSQILAIITDMQDQGAGGLNNPMYKPVISYIPTAQYRYVDLQSTTPLNTIDINIFWADKFGNLHSFLLASGCSASVKLLFRRKDSLLDEKF